MPLPAIANRQSGAVVEMKPSRRALLQMGGLVAAQGIVLGSPAILRRPAEAAPADGLPQPPLLGSDHVDYRIRTDPRAKYLAKSFNRAKVRVPRLRALCKTPEAVSELVQWARTHSIPFGLRSGGHCFEGYSQNDDLVIDVRRMNQVRFDAAAQTVTVGAGAVLGQVYNVLGKYGNALPAGWCQTVGIAGLTLGGGIGYLARTHGLTCDSLLSLELIDPQGRRLDVDADTHGDLFWACRGGGGGSFGAVTEFRFQTYRIPEVLVFEAEWILAPAQAGQMFQAWQALAPSAPDEISSVLFIRQSDRRSIQLRMVGQSLGPHDQLRRHIADLANHYAPVDAPGISRLSFIDAANHIRAPQNTGTGRYKYKSDMLLQPLPRTACVAMMEEVVRSGGRAGLMCEALGGAAARIGKADTAYPHRGRPQLYIQYWASWRDQGERDYILGILGRMYDAGRPESPSGVYVNYRDGDLIDWPVQYWQTNLPRLSRIKKEFDSENIFRHPQSVPPG